MKKIFATIFFVLIFSGSCLAISSDLKESYLPKETAIVKLSGSILNQITESDVKLKRNNVEIGFNYGVEKLSGEYYIWFVAPDLAANYNLIVEDITTNEGGSIQISDYQESFSVNGTESDYTSVPGAIFASGNFYVDVILNEDTSKQINVDFPSRNVNLQPGQNRINFKTSDFSGTSLWNINLGKYSIPAYVVGSGNNVSNNSTQNNSNIIVNETEEQNQSSQNFTAPINVSAESNFSFGSSVVVAKIPENSESATINFEITNLGNSSILPLFFYNKASLEILPEQRTLNPGETFIYNLTIKENSGDREIIRAFSGNSSKYFILMINKSAEIVNATTEYVEEEVDSYFYCSELGGIICSSEESCSGTESESLDGVCCLEECSVETSGGFSWIGYLLGGILLVVLIFIFIKYRRTKPNGERIVSDKFSFAEKNLP